MPSRATKPSSLLVDPKSSHLGNQCMERAHSLLSLDLYDMICSLDVLISSSIWKMCTKLIRCWVLSLEFEIIPRKTQPFFSSSEQ